MTINREGLICRHYMISLIDIIPRPGVRLELARIRSWPLSKVCCSALIFALTLLIHGCGGGDLYEIKHYIQEVKSKPAARIEPLPQVTQYASVVYSAGSLPSPFTSMDLRKNANNSDNSALLAHKDRPPEPLESFSLDSLKMVGTMVIEDKTFAIILDPEGGVHRVRDGNYIGSNFGKITAISGVEIEVNEIVPDSDGAWRLRKSTILLGE